MLNIVSAGELRQMTGFFVVLMDLRGRDENAFEKICGCYWGT